LNDDDSRRKSFVNSHLMDEVLTLAVRGDRGEFWESKGVTCLPVLLDQFFGFVQFVFLCEDCPTID
jgi:hypothetical protein